MKVAVIPVVVIQERDVFAREWGIDFERHPRGGVAGIETARRSISDPDATGVPSSPDNGGAE